MDMVRHDDEGMDGEAALIAIAKEGVNHKFRAFRALEEASALIGENRDGICRERSTDCGHVIKSIPQGEPSLKAWAT